MQGGIDPRYDGASYVGFLRAAKAGECRIHVHAFSPLEVSQGAEADGRHRHTLLLCDDRLHLFHR